MKENKNICQQNLPEEVLSEVNGGANNASIALKAIDSPLQKALNQEASIGAQMSRLTFSSGNLSTSSENLQSAESTYRDADMAKEMTEYTKNNVLMQAATAMLSKTP